MNDDHGYIDLSIPELADAKPVSYPGAKLSPSEHNRFYDDVQGMSEARPQPEKPRVGRRIPLCVRECCEHPVDDEYNEIDAFGIRNSCHIVR
jgi:hypothetical protein